MKSGANGENYMGDTMKISKELKISGVVVKPANIRELAKKVYEEYGSDKESDGKNINFILRGIDGTQYESEDIEVFSDGGILDTRRIVAVEMTYSNYTDDKRISIKLEHDIKDYGWRNVIFVSGPDEVWVNGVIKHFEDAIVNWEKQVNWPYKYSWLLTIIFAIGINFPCSNILNFIIHLIKPESSVTLGPLFFSFFMVGLLLALYIVDKLKELYPVVELRIGPEHTQLEVKRRRKLYAVISIVVIPLVISLIIELIKIIIM